MSKRLLREIEAALWCVVFFPAERARWQRRSAAAGVIRADFKGNLRLPDAAGPFPRTRAAADYLLCTAPSLRDFERPSQAATSMELSGREHKVLSLAMKPQ